MRRDPPGQPMLARCPSPVPPSPASPPTTTSPARPWRSTCPRPASAPASSPASSTCWSPSLLRRRDPRLFGIAALQSDGALAHVALIGHPDRRLPGAPDDGGDAHPRPVAGQAGDGACARCATTPDRSPRSTPSCGPSSGSWRSTPSPGCPAFFSAMLSAKGKRLGDHAAGTYVVRSRVRLQLAPPALMPPQLAAWARTADMAALPTGLALAVRQYLGRSGDPRPAAPPGDWGSGSPTRWRPTWRRRRLPAPRRTPTSPRSSRLAASATAPGSPREAAMRARLVRRSAGPMVIGGAGRRGGHRHAGLVLWVVFYAGVGGALRRAGTCPHRRQPAGPPSRRWRRTCNRMRAATLAPEPGASKVRRDATLAAYDDALAQACRALGVPDPLTDLPPGTEREAERLHIEWLLEAGRAAGHLAVGDPLAAPRDHQAGHGREHAEQRRPSARRRSSRRATRGPSRRSWRPPRRRPCARRTPSRRRRRPARSRSAGGTARPSAARSPPSPGRRTG